MPVPANVKELIHDTYEAAINGGSIKLTETKCEKLKDLTSGMQFLVSYAPSLAAKPEREVKKDTKDKFDPFANPPKELTVLSDLTGDNQYRLLLNKFPIVPEHVILVTKEFKDQGDSLTPNELLTSYKLLTKLNDDDRQHLVFYNCGPASGSSQNHKHLQLFQLPKGFVPFQQVLCSGKSHFLPNLQEEPLQDPKVSFAHYVLPLPESSEYIDEELLAMCYFSLLQRTLTFFQDWLNEKPDQVKSYNVLLTEKWICLVPRSTAGSNGMEFDEPIPEIVDGKYDVGINATGYLGLLLAKTQEAYDRMRADPELIDKMLFSCGFPNSSGTKPNEYNY